MRAASLLEQPFVPGALSITGLDPQGKSALMDRVADLLRSEGAATVPVEAVPVAKVLLSRVRLLGCTFVDDGGPIEAERVLSPEMFLPAIAWSVQEAGMALLGADLGCVLRRDPRALFGAVVSVPPVTGHIVDVIRYLFFQRYADLMFGLQPGAQVDVYPSYLTLRRGFADMLQAREASFEGEIPWPLQNPAPSPRH